MIGQVDVKSSPVYFYVQREAYYFNTTNTPIPFDRERLNIGGAMNLTSGIFTAPRDGIYFFAFTGLAWLPASSSQAILSVSMNLNVPGTGSISGRADDVGTDGQYETTSWQSTFNLAVGDQIWLEIYSLSKGVYLYGNYQTHFSGYLMEEKIAVV